MTAFRMIQTAKKATCTHTKVIDPQKREMEVAMRSDMDSVARMECSSWDIRCTLRAISFSGESEDRPA